MKIINPATEETITEVQESTIESIQSQYEMVRQAQLAWAKVELLTRIELLKKFSDLLKADIEHLATVLTSEVGKPLQQSRNEINGAIARIAWLTENGPRYLNEEIMKVDGSMTEKIVYEPLGVVANISAWNYPYLVGVNVFIPALMAGNGVLYKPSEFSTLTGLEIQKRLYAAGIPEQVFQVIIGGKTAGEALLNLPLDGYFFTGSNATGTYIYQKVAAKMVPCQLELGGKDPLYVTDDVADVSAVAAATADGAFYNNGQSCCAVERIYVHEKVYDEYVSAFVKEVASYKLGDPMESGVYLGAVTRKEQLSLLESQVQEAISKGAQLHCGGKRAGGKGSFFEPTVLTNVTNEMRIMREESFGPVIGIHKVKNDEEAIRLMNDTEYGLTASVYSSNEERAYSILAQMNSGTGYWNCCDRVSAALPWSGRKHSGFGATLSHAGIRAFTKVKALHLRK